MSICASCQELFIAAVRIASGTAAAVTHYLVSFSGAPGTRLSATHSSLLATQNLLTCENQHCRP